MALETVLQIIIWALFISHNLGHECIHDKLETDIQINDVSNSLYSSSQERILQGSQSIQIMYDTSGFTGISDTFRDYIIESLLTPVQNILQAALKVPARNGKLKVGKVETLCGGSVAVPTVYRKDGVDADLVIFLKARNDPSEIYVASATSCLLDSTTKRPVMGRITYNLDKVIATTNDARREKDILVTLHEITHVLGFSNSLYKYFINPLTGKTLSGHYYTKTVSGLTTTVLNLPSLTSRLRSHFNCPTLEGAYLENQGGAQSAGSHFERRIFYNEYMTSSAIIDTRFTEFTLALLEGTGWYTPNYAMADPMTWGKNEGCSFIEGACMNKGTKSPNFKEFCSPLMSKTCSWTKRAGGSCGAFQAQKNDSIPSAMDWWSDKTVVQDSFSDNCPIVVPFNNVDCEDPDLQASATLSAESYGYGSKCFMGSLYPTGSLTGSFPLCFKPTCRGNSKDGYYVEVKVGGQSVNCYAAGPIGVAGYGGVLTCPDPAEFCGQIMSEGFCRRGCSGKGSCVDRECVCQDGWGGFDCSKPVYEDQCSRCANGNPLKTTCFKDTCECNPANATCMCPTGTPNITDCIQSVNDYINSLNKDKYTPVSVVTNDEKHGISTQMLITIICGTVGGVILILGAFFGYRYVKKLSKKKKAVTKVPSRPRPPKLELHMESIYTRDIEGQSNPNSAFSSKPLSLQSHNDSPLIAQNIPDKGKASIPSIFKRSTSKIHAVAKSAQEVEINAAPDSGDRLPDIEDPPIIQVTELGTDSPQIKSPAPF